MLVSFEEEFEEVALIGVDFHFFEEFNNEFAIVGEIQIDMGRLAVFYLD